MQLLDLQATWNGFGEHDPLWAILTDPTKRDNKWNLAEFFSTGDREIANLLAYVESLGLEIQTDGEALDFGCGIGRLSQALCVRFRCVSGVDIAPSMLELAARFNSYGDRCVYVQNAFDDLQIFESNRFAFIYSNYVLQHMQPKHALHYIEEFLRVLAPGGSLVFQLPCETHATTERVKAALPVGVRRRLRKLVAGTSITTPVMEMHTVSRSTVQEKIRTSGGRLVHIQPDLLHDARWSSVLYYITK